MREVNVMLFILLIIWTIVIFWIPISASAHEGHGFTHMEGSSGPMVGSKYCDGILVWIFEDGHCSFVIFDHGIIHIKPLPECRCKGE